ncbi:PAS domain [Pseudocohnilembus persalinus]|uniref:PAS domain n=1 Tax=Pseudocohnilembus persalinus TaxID=266149 RepID=A0A0V0R7K3_PSEPJ|nr:PAS domain [Pseudocohnilembus persalinus]|eukprot:KRX10486.1 PAS domain [Pseudocohnilembus persalinus]
MKCSEGKLLFFQNVECWSGNHIFHVFMGVLSSLLFLNLVSKIILTNFEGGANTKDKTAKLSGKHNYDFLIYQFLVVLAYIVLDDSSYVFIVLALYFAGSLIIFLLFHFNSPYYNNNCAKLWNVLTALNFWTQFSVAFSYLASSIVDGMIIYKQQALLELSHAEENSPPFDISFTIFRLKMIIEKEIMAEQKQIKQQNKQIEEGLQQLDIISQMRFQALERKLRQQIETSTQYHMEFWSSMSEDAPDIRKIERVSKYQDEVIHDQQRANEIMKRTIGLTHHQRFKIRNKKDINDQEEEEIENIESLPKVTISLEGDSLGMIINVNLAICSMFGYNKNELVNMKINQLMPYIYAQHHDEFLEKFLETQSLSYFKQERIVYYQNNQGLIFPSSLKVHQIETLQNGIQLVGTFKQDNIFKPTAYILIDNEFIIDSVSSSCLHYFNLDKKNLFQMDHDITRIFPYIKAKQEAYIGKNSMQYIDYKPLSWCVNDQFKSNIKNQQNYQYKCSLHPILLQNGDQLGYLAKFEMVRPNQDGNITSNLSQDLSFYQENKNQKIKQLYKRDMVNFRLNQRKFMFGFLPRGVIFVPKYVGEIIDVEPENENQTDREETANITQGSLALNNSIVSKNSKKQYQQSNDEYFIYLPQKRRKLFAEQQDKKPTISNKFQILKKKITSGEYKVNDQKTQSQGIQSNEDFYQITENGQKDKIQESNDKISLLHKTKKDIDYAKGIRVVRLYKGNYSNAADFEKTEDNEDLENQEESLFKINEYDDKKGDVKVSHNFTDILKNKRSINKLILFRIEPIQIIYLTRYVISVLFVLFIVALIEFFIIKSQYSTIDKNLSLISYSNKKNSDLQGILGNVRDLRLLNEGVFDYLNQEQKNNYYQELKEEMEGLLFEIDLLKNFLYNNSVDLQKELYNLLYEDEIKMFYSEEKYEMDGLNSGTEKIISKAHTLQSSDLNEFTWDNSNVYFVEYNLFNDFFQGCIRSSFLYVDNLDKLTTDQAVVLLIILVAVSAVITLTVVLIYPVLYKINQSKTGIFELFLEIKGKIVSELQNQCENFLYQLRQDEDDQGSVGDMEKNQLVDEDQEAETGLIKQRKKKRFINKIENKTINIFVKFFFGVIMLELYYIYNFYDANQLLNNLQKIIPELNKTQISESFYGFIENAEKQILINDTRLIWNQEPVEYVITGVERIYKLDSDILKLHSENLQILSQNYKDNFQQIITLDPCPTLYNNDLIENISECQKFADSTVAQGITVASTRFFENLRQILNLYQYIEEGTFTWSDYSDLNFQTVTGDTQKDQKLNLFNLEESREVRGMQGVYLKQSYRFLNKQLQESLVSKLDTSKIQRIFLIFAFFLLEILMFIIFWKVMVVNKINKEIWVSRALLTIIPHNTIVKLKGVKRYLRILFQSINKQKSKEDQVNESHRFKDNNNQNQKTDLYTL